MANPSELTKTLCAHCEREIPTSNIDLHYAHCSRNLQKCTICGEMVPRKHADEHYNEAHAPVECSKCSETVQREVWALHKGEQCSQRIITCEYCELPLPAVDLFEHQEVCGNRTELCPTCNKYIRLCERDNHEIQFHSHSNDTAESSRDERTILREGSHRRQREEEGAYRRLVEEEGAQRRQREEEGAQRRQREEERAHRRQARDSSQKKILFTIALSGIAVLVGSFFLQKRVDAVQQQ